MKIKFIVLFVIFAIAAIAANPDAFSNSVSKIGLNLPSEHAAQ